MNVGVTLLFLKWKRIRRDAGLQNQLFPTDKARFAIIRGFHVSRHTITHESHTLLTWTQFLFKVSCPKSVSRTLLNSYTSPLRLRPTYSLQKPCTGLDDYACIYVQYTIDYSTCETLRVRHAPSIPRAALSTHNPIALQTSLQHFHRKAVYVMHAYMRRSQQLESRWQYIYISLER